MEGNFRKGRLDLLPKVRRRPYWSTEARQDPPPVQEPLSTPIAPTTPRTGSQTSPDPKNIQTAPGKEDELEMKILELGKELESSKKMMEDKLQATENRLLETENRLLETENRLLETQNRLWVAEDQLCELKGQIREIPREAGALDSNVHVRSVPDSDVDVCRNRAGRASVEAIEVGYFRHRQAPTEKRVV